MTPEHAMYKITATVGDTTVVLKLTINFDRSNFTIDQVNGKVFTFQRCKNKDRCLAVSQALTEAATMAEKLLNKEEEK
jgi:hypothetical protein